MRATLVEVLGPERGVALHSLEWLRDRVRAHLDPGRLDGAVLLAADASGGIHGHLLARLEPGAPPRLGLVATVFVAPAARRRGIAGALFDAGEDWLRARGAEILAYDTAEDHAVMLRLLAARGYAVSLRAPEQSMVRLTRPA